MGNQTTKASSDTPKPLSPVPNPLTLTRPFRKSGGKLIFSRKTPERPHSNRRKSLPKKTPPTVGGTRQLLELCQQAPIPAEVASTTPSLNSQANLLIATDAPFEPSFLTRAQEVRSLTLSGNNIQTNDQSIVVFDFFTRAPNLESLSVLGKQAGLLELSGSYFWSFLENTPRLQRLILADRKVSMEQLESLETFRQQRSIRGLPPMHVFLVNCTLSERAEGWYRGFCAAHRMLENKSLEEKREELRIHLRTLLRKFETESSSGSNTLNIQKIRCVLHYLNDSPLEIAPENLNEFLDFSLKSIDETLQGHLKENVKFLEEAFAHPRIKIIQTQTAALAPSDHTSRRISSTKMRPRTEVSFVSSLSDTTGEDDNIWTDVSSDDEDTEANALTQPLSPLLLKKSVLWQKEEMQQDPIKIVITPPSPTPTGP